MIYAKIIFQITMWMILPFMSYWTLQVWTVSSEFGILLTIKTLVAFIACIYGTYIIYKDYKEL